jgi:hypothetical protein
MINRLIILACGALVATGLIGCSERANAQVLAQGNLVISISQYVGNASTVTVGQALPGGGIAVADGTYPNVFKNDTIDSSFGVTSPIILRQITTSGVFVSSYAVPTGLLTTSFSSKSELALNLSTDRTSLTFLGYAAPINQLDVSNSNTPGIIEPGNPVVTAPAYRAVAQLDANGNIQVTTTNAYAGNNGRAGILDNANNLYLTVGNAGNGNGSAAVTAATGVQIVTPGQNATPNTPGTIKVGSFNITQNGFKADKTAKDDNYRGETIFNNTLYVTKGSGSNGINTVYQVGNAGQLPTAATAATAPITILPGLPAGLAKSADAMHPFGIFFANANTLYVADEGNQGLSDTVANNTNAGLQKWSLVGGTWQLDYVLQNGLNLDQPYTVAGYPTALDPETDGLRNITGQVNADGTVSLYAVTSTVSANGDPGADPNMLVAINDNLAFTSSAQATGELFTTIQSAGFGEVIRGVSFTPVGAVPEPSPVSAMGLGIVGLTGVLLIKSRKGRTARS